jgi:hypothetical protein
MEEVEEYVARALANFGVIRLAAGTVVTSPAAMSGDELTVVMEPSALAVPVKALRGLVVPGERVVLGLVGADPRKAEWVCLGPLSEPATVSSDGINGAATTSGTDTTASASYVNLAGTGSVTSFSPTKRYATTRVKVWMYASMFVTVGPTFGRFGVRINGVDHDVFNLPINPATSHQGASGTTYITGVPAGVYTIQARWFRSGGTGTLTRDSQDWLSVNAEEVM